MPRLLTVGDCAAQLNVSPAYVRILVDTGRLRGQRTVGGVRLVSPEEVRRFCASQNRKMTRRKGNLPNASASEGNAVKPAGGQPETGEAK